MTKTFSLGIIGHPIGHTLSPVIHGAAAEANGFGLEYEAFDVAPGSVGEFVARFRSGEMDGFNVTVPHKLEVMESLDFVTDEALAIGAVNTVFRDGDRIGGDNTDGYGFITPIRINAGIDVRGSKVFIYGAGGAARAVVHSLASAGAARIDIANRTESKAAELADLASGLGAESEAMSLNSNKLFDSVTLADIIVNTTSVGMKGAAGSGAGLPAIEAIGEGKLAVDIVYRPLKTPFLEQAGAAGAKTLDGLWMLIHQGAKSFERWTGGRFPVDAARDALLAELKET